MVLSGFAATALAETTPTMHDAKLGPTAVSIREHLRMGEKARRRELRNLRDGRCRRGYQAVAAHWGWRFL